MVHACYSFSVTSERYRPGIRLLGYLAHPHEIPVASDTNTPTFTGPAPHRPGGRSFQGCRGCHLSSCTIIVRLPMEHSICLWPLFGTNKVSPSTAGTQLHSWPPRSATRRSPIPDHMSDPLEQQDMSNNNPIRYIVSKHKSSFDFWVKSQIAWIKLTKPQKVAALCFKIDFLNEF